MPVTTRSQVSGRKFKRVTFVLNAKSYPRFMTNFPFEIREMIYKLLLPGPRSIEVMFIPTRRDPDPKTRNDPTNTLKMIGRFVDTSSDSQKILAALSQVNHETRGFVLRYYTHAFKTRSSTGTWFSFKWDTLAFTTLLSSRSRRHKLFNNQSIQADVAQVQRIAYLFENHYSELSRIQDGIPDAWYFGTLFQNLQEVIVSLPLKHFEGCRQCNGTPPKEEYGEEAGSVQSANDDFEQLKKKLANAGIVWNAKCVYETHCWKISPWEQRNLVLDRPAKRSKSG